MSRLIPAVADDVAPELRAELNATNRRCRSRAGTLSQTRSRPLIASPVTVLLFILKRYGRDLRRIGNVTSLIKLEALLKMTWTDFAASNKEDGRDWRQRAGFRVYLAAVIAR